MIRSSVISFVAAFQERDTMEGDRRPKRRMQEKKGFDSIIFLVPFERRFKKNIGNEKVFVPFPGTFSNEQKESKNHTDPFYDHISESFESY